MTDEDLDKEVARGIEAAMKSRFVMTNVGLAGINLHGGDAVPEGAYLKRYDPDARDGVGEAEWTTDVTQALVFESAGDAMTLYRTQSTVRPWRSDGKPNRPLTAFTIEVSPL